jgi:phosphoribosyl 1,2-cyclic phosphodiesterase
LYLTVYSLASGSSGNSMLVTDGRTSFLIDAGIGIRRLVASMAEVGVVPGSLSGIFLTHEHSDHTTGAIRLARRYKIPLISSAATLEAVCRNEHKVPAQVLDPGEEISFDDIHIRSFNTSHDAVKPMGFTIEQGKQRICYATDTGYITPDIIREAKKADLVILESNHDVQRLMQGPYPHMLKRRILSNHGHLSNAAAAAFLLGLASDGRPVTFWLAHLSAVNNTPKLAFDEAKAKLKPFLGRTAVLEVAQRDQRSLIWQAKSKAFQLALEF